MDELTTEQRLDLKKYEELYSVTKAGLQDEHARYGRLDEKASRHLAALSLLLAAAGGSGCLGWKET